MKECDTCGLLLHYEHDPSKKDDLPRCSIEFRDGRAVPHPCPDYIKKEKYEASQNITNQS